MKSYLVWISIFVVGLTSSFMFISQATAANVSCSDLEGRYCRVGLGDTLELTVTAYDDQGSTFAGVPVNFAWTIYSDSDPSNPATLGTFVGAPQTVSLDSSATAFIKINNNTATTGRIQVTATYGLDVASTTYSVVAICSRDPRLVFGVGEVKDAGSENYNWQKATAEVMETCSDDYLLYSATEKIIKP